MRVLLVYIVLWPVVECVLFLLVVAPKKSDMFGDDGTKETLLPVMYDVHRRLHLM